MQKAHPDTYPVPPMPRLRLTQARTDRHWSQHEVAERIGTTHINVSRWERGMTRPGPYFRRRLCQLFGKTEEELDLTSMPESSAEVESVATSHQEPLHLTPQGPGEAKATAASPAYTSSSSTATREAVYDSAIPLLPATPLVGRDEEMARLRQRLCLGGNVALTALNGLPGVGKTALAIAQAHDPAIRAHFQDGILWAGLGPLRNTTGILSRWGTLLGISSTEMASLSSSEAWALSLRTAIGSRYLLLIIDDAWQIEDALTFKVGGPNCAHLITTRFPGIAAHITLDGATTIKELDEEEGIALLRALAPRVVDLEEKKAHELVQAVGGLPLALTLIGNYLRKLAYSSTPRRVTAALEQLVNVEEERLCIREPHGPVEKHSSLPSDTPLSLQSVFVVTDQQLSVQARAGLYALSVFPPKPHTFSEEAALAITGCTIEALDMLSDFGLLESSSAGRYTLHQTIADYARLHHHKTAAYERLIAYVTDYLGQHRKDYELLELESAMIFAAIETAHTLKKHSELVRIVTTFTPFLLSRGLYQQAEQLLQRAQEVALAHCNPHDIASTLLYQGQLAEKQGNFAQAEVTFHEGLALAQGVGDVELITAFLTDLGGITWKRGDYTQAISYLQEGLALARQMEHQEHLSDILKRMGSIASRQGDYTHAEAYYQESLGFIRQIGDREQVCIILNNLGMVAGEQGRYNQSEAYLLEALELARQIRHREWICGLLNNLGNVASELGNYTKAETYFQEGLGLMRGSEQLERTSVLLISLGSTARKQRNYTQTEIYLHDGLDLAQKVGIPQIRANGLYEYGNLYLDQQQPHVAEAAFREMLAISPEGSLDLVALAQYGLARTIAAQGNRNEARQLGETSAATLEAIGHRNAKEVRDWLSVLSS
jgi:tetratricopeptide (TPR) repeat protein/transcriptional regulator with XRE-family HTH domain